MKHSIQEGVTKQGDRSASAGDQVTLPSGSREVPSSSPEAQPSWMEVNALPRKHSLGAFHTWFCLLKFHTNE